MTSIRSYALVTGAYWGFTITDGALRMLVVLHFYRLGYDAVSIAFLFLFYEFFGIVTNLFGGWIASRSGVKVTLFGGLALQIFALLMLAGLNEHGTHFASVVYVMIAQALSGIAKDLTKMSSKSAIKVVVPGGKESALFQWVARLTGSKNALKGLGFFVGGALLGDVRFCWRAHRDGGCLAGGAARHCRNAFRRPGAFKEKGEVHVAPVEEPGDQLAFDRPPLPFRVARCVVRGGITRLSQSTRLVDVHRWSISRFMGDRLWHRSGGGAGDIARPRKSQRKRISRNRVGLWARAVVPASLVLILRAGLNPGTSLIWGLAIFAVVFAINSAVHSYLVLAYTDEDNVALNVGFYYMANACGRLLGTLASGIVFQIAGFAACLWCSTAMVLAAALLSLPLTKGRAVSIGPVSAGDSE